VSESSTGAYSAGSSAGAEQSTVKEVATQGTQAAGQAASDVRDTAADQAQRVAAEARTQARTVAADVRGKLGEQARTQNDRLVGSIRETAGHLDEMRGDRSGTPAATVVARVADGGRQLADYLDQHGPEGVLREVQDFARRRPGAFLATALAAGFVVGRLGKSVAKADPEAGSKPTSDAYASGYSTAGRHQQTYASDPGVATQPVPGYGTTTATEYTGTDYASTGSGTDYAGTGTGTDYAGTGTGTEYTSTGTGTPLVVEEEYPVAGREPRP
jgi:hypothetical protein